MPAAAFALALGSAFLHALWNVLLARERDTEAATAVAMATSVLVFAPVAVLTWDVDPKVWPFVVVTSLLQLTYFALLAAAYSRAEISFVYPLARGVAPVLVLLVGVVALGVGATALQALGVVLVGVGVLLVRGLGHGDAVGLTLGLSIASVIAAYTLVDKDGIAYADPIVYLELGMAPAAAGYLLLVLALSHGGQRLRDALRPAPAGAGGNAARSSLSMGVNSQPATPLCMGISTETCGTEAATALANGALHLQLDQAVHLDRVLHRQLLDDRLDEAVDDHGGRLLG